MADTFARMRQLIGTTAEWAANDLVIGLGEFALEKLGGGAVRMKLGDGVAKYSALPYFDPGIFDFVLKDGDTMTGPLVAPGITINAEGLTVSGGNSEFSTPVFLGPFATTAEPGAADDNNAKVPTTHWVQTKMAGVITGLEYKGTWDAATNTPPLASGGLGVPTPVRGDFYMVSVAGSTELDGITEWVPGDFVAFNGIAWQRIPQPLTHDQIVAGLGYVPADEADLDALEAEAIPKSIVDAAGDLIVGTDADTVARLPRGTEGQLLQSTASGIAWSAPPAAAMILFSETELVAPASQIIAAIPPTFKALHLEWQTRTIGLVVAQHLLQGTLAGAPVNPATHTSVIVSGSVNGSPPTTVTQASQSAWGIGGVYFNSGSAKLRNGPNLPGGTQTMVIETHQMCIGAASAMYNFSLVGTGMPMPPLIDGVRIVCTASTPNFDTGSWLRVFAIV